MSVREATSELTGFVRWRVFLGVWLLAIASVFLLAASAAPTEIVVLVFAGLGTLVIGLVPARAELARHLAAQARKQADIDVLNEAAPTNVAAEKLAVGDPAEADIRRMAAVLRFSARRDLRDSGLKSRRTLTGALSRAFVLSAVRQLPEQERDRWREEWLAEVYEYRERSSRALAFAFFVRANAPGFAEILKQEVDERASAGQAGLPGAGQTAGPDTAPSEP